MQLGEALLRSKSKEDVGSKLCPGVLCPMQTFTAPRPGNYYFTVAGAQGGTTLLTTAPYGSLGGLGATVTANVSLQQGAAVLVIVGGQGAPGDVDQPGAGGGGLSALYTDPNVDAPSVVAGALVSAGHEYH